MKNRLNKLSLISLRKKLILVMYSVLFITSITCVDIYVNCNHTGNGDGSYQNPYTTIQAAINSITTVPIDSIVVFQIMSGIYNENVILQRDTLNVLINTWTFRAFNNSLVTISGNVNNGPLVKIINNLGNTNVIFNVIFKDIVFKSSSSDSSCGFFATSPNVIQSLKFDSCKFLDLTCGIYITESINDPNLVYIDSFEVVNCEFNGIQNQGVGILTFAKNRSMGGSENVFIRNIRIYNNSFLTDRITNASSGYSLTSIAIINNRKEIAYDSVFVNNNIFINTNTNIFSTAINLYELNKYHYTQWPSFNEYKLKVRVFDNEIRNHNVISQLTKLKLYRNKARLDNNYYTYFMIFASNEANYDTLFMEWNYVKANKVHNIIGASLIDTQNTYVGNDCYLSGTRMNANIVNCLITGYRNNFELYSSGVQTDFSFYDTIQNDGQVQYGHGIVSGDPLIELDDPNMTYYLKWNAQEKSPCIDAGYQPFEHQWGSGVPLIDWVDIGVVQFDEFDHYTTIYQFPGGAGSRNRIKWMSFPVIDNVYDEENVALNFFDGLWDPEILNRIEWKTNFIDEQENEHVICYDENIPGWFGQNTIVNSPQGYKVTMSQNNTQDRYIRKTGILQSADTPITINAAIVYPDSLVAVENWIGYFLPYPTSVFDAFQGIINRLYFIQTQNWTLARSRAVSGAPWISPISNSHRLTLSPGDMVVVKGYYNNDSFQWNSQAQNAPEYKLPTSEYFTFIEKTEYVPIFITFQPMNMPKEIAVFVNGECKGAAVVTDSLAQICAYIYDEMGNNPELEFVLYYDSKNQGAVPEYEVWNPGIGKYTKEKITLREKKDYYRIKITNANLDNIPLPMMHVTNHPNPFNPQTTVKYTLGAEGRAGIGIYNLKGQLVKILYKGEKKAGTYELVWDGRDDQGRQCASGVYFCKLEHRGKSVSRKLILMK